MIFVIELHHLTSTRSAAMADCSTNHVQSDTSLQVWFYICHLVYPAINDPILSFYIAMGLKSGHFAGDENCTNIDLKGDQSTNNRCGDS